SVFNSRESDVDDSPVNDRFKTGKGFHAVPPPYTRNYMPLRPDLSFVRLDDYVYKTKVSETETSISKTNKDIVQKPKTVRSSAPIIKDWDTDSDNDSENTHRQVEYHRKSQNPRDNRRNWNGMMTQKLGNGFESIKKACFVCGSLNHLIKDYDFHDKKMVDKPVLNNKGRVIGQREIRPVWNNALRVNHQNKLTHPHPKRNFVPPAVATKSKHVPVNAAKQNSPKAATSISTTSFKTARVNNVTTAGPKAVVSAAMGNGENAGNPQYTLQDQGIFDSGCSRHMTGNKSFLTDYQEIDGGFVAFGGSPKGDVTMETEFKNNDMNQFCGMKGIKREIPVFPGTRKNPKQNRVQKERIGEKKNTKRVARTMLADSVLPTTFWAEAVNTTCYVQNKVSVNKPHNKTPYELLHGKFDGKADEGFLVRYSINSKAFRVFNTRTRKVEENLHITFLENKPNVAGSGPDWLFDIDLLTNSMNYESVTTGNQANRNAGINDNVDVVPTQQYILLSLLYDCPQSSEDAVTDDASKKTNEKLANEGEINGQEKEGGASNKEGDQNIQDFRGELDNLLVQQKEVYATRTNIVSTVSPFISAAGQSFDNTDDLPINPLIPDLEDTVDLLNTGIFSGAYDVEDEGAEADLNNLETTMNMDVKSAFLYGTIKEEVYVFQPLSFEDPHFPKKVYKVEKALYGLHHLLEPDDAQEIPDKFYRGVHFLLRVTVKTTSTSIETKKALLKDEEAKDVDVHLYRSMIGSLMYLTDFRLDIMFAVCACARDSPFDLEVFSDNDYAGASLDKKSTTGGVVDSNQMLDYEFNFMNTKIHIDNESTICIVKNPVFHAKTKHIEIRHHFIRDSYEKRLIQVIKIHTDHNVVDLLTKAFDVSSISNEFGCSNWVVKLMLLGRIWYCWAKFVDQHNMVDCLEKSKGNADFHEIVDFLIASSVHYALTFWNTAHSQTVNDVKQIHATVDGKTIVISESSVRSDLYFNDEDGI
ncbi:putative ribonuclease H-like domain-containing protein, partial [Tanacetum coccineum]